MSETLEGVAGQIRTALAPRVIEDDFDRGYAKAIERVVEFLTVDLAEGNQE